MTDTQLNESQSASQHGPEVRESGQIMRVDPPHSTGVDLSDSADLDDNALDLDQLGGMVHSDSDESAEDVLLHAGQLAAHLRGRQRDLDRREGQLNARAAKLERDLRTSRMWFQDREKESADRESGLQQRIAELEERAAALAAASEFEDDNQTELETQLAEELSQLKSEREDHANERDASRIAARRRERALSKIEKEAATELRRRRDHLDKRSASLDRRQAALEKLQMGVSRMQRETLETRLVVEQMWSHLAGNVPATELTKTLSKARGQLAEYYRLEGDKMEEHRQELVELSTKLDGRRLDLRNQRNEFESWAEKKHREIEGQAAHLIAREQELDQQEQYFHKLQNDWESERQEYERRIRELTQSVESKLSGIR